MIVEKYFHNREIAATNSCYFFFCRVVDKISSFVRYNYIILTDIKKSILENIEHTFCNCFRVNRKGGIAVDESKNIMTNEEYREEIGKMFEKIDDNYKLKWFYSFIKEKTTE